MAWFYDLPLRRKLTGSFMAVAALCLVLGGIGLRAIHSIQVMSDDITGNQVPSMIGLSQINAGIIDARRLEMAMIVYKLNKDEAAFAKRLDEYRSGVLRDKIEKGRALYEPLTRPSEEDVLWKEHVKAFADYASYMDRQIALLQAGSADSARVIAGGEGHRLFIATRSTMDKLSDLWGTYVAANQLAVANSVTSAKYQLLAAVLVAIALALGIGFMVGGYLTRTLSLISERSQQLRSTCINNLGKGMEALSRGELDMKVEYGTELMKLEQKDELGALARHVDDMITHSVATIASYERAAASMRETVRESQALILATRLGKLETRADASRFQGGFHALVDGLNQMCEGVSVPLREANTVLQRLAERDLSARMTGRYEGEYARMKEAINSAAANLDETLSQVQDAAAQVANAGSEITAGSQSLAQAASEQAGAIEEVSSSLQEMASMTKQNSDNTRIATTYAAETRASAADGVARMKELSSAINKIKTSADQTAKIVKTIDEIAFQTNLLALNAAVEAARAGDAGRGFAVVADEVRNLAMRSAEAAKSTAALIEESVVNANGGVTMNAEVLKTLGAINAQVVKVSDVVAEIAAATEQQSQGVEQINGAVLSMNGVTQQMASGAEQSSAAAEELASQSHMMTDMVGQFQLTNAGAAKLRPAARRPTHPNRNHSRPAARPSKAMPNGNGGSTRFEAEKLLPFDDDALLTSF
ncbi:MAG: methyl-accepting chemotaxis protein [bacterium]